ncbi:hypothetical protein JW823_08055 [bacterium]|nr:hypothetical protein [candidate division CSSED10-310 bacterium]
MRLNLTKKLMFSFILLLFFFGGVEIILRIADIKFPDAPVVVERIMNTDVRYDWLEEDPLVFWKLKGPEPGTMVFRSEKIPPAEKDAMCSQFSRWLSIEPSVRESGDHETGTLITDVENASNRTESHAAESTTGPAADKQVSPSDESPGVTPRHWDPSASGAHELKQQMPRLSANFDSYTLLPLSQEENAEQILCLGDSCTFFGRPSYSKRLETLLNCNQKTAYQVVNAGVPAYSSFQGARLYRNRLCNTPFRMVTVYFGWNDHWLARSLPDAAEAARSESTSQSLMMSRLLGLIRLDDGIRIAAGRLASFKKTIEPESRPFRVSIPDYRRNLADIAGVAKEHGTQAVFLTAPHGFDPGNPPQYLKDMQYFNDLSQLIAVHEAYNDCVRETAQETGALLIDLARHAGNRPDRKILFLQDGIHLSDTGLEYISMVLSHDIGAALETRRTQEEIQ